LSINGQSGNNTLNVMIRPIKLRDVSCLEYDDFHGVSTITYANITSLFINALGGGSTYNIDSSRSPPRSTPERLQAFEISPKRELSACAHCPEDGSGILSLDDQTRGNIFTP